MSRREGRETLEVETGEADRQTDRINALWQSGALSDLASDKLERRSEPGWQG